MPPSGKGAGLLLPKGVLVTQYEQWALRFLTTSLVLTILMENSHLLHLGSYFFILAIDFYRLWLNCTWSTAASSQSPTAKIPNNHIFKQVLNKFSWKANLLQRNPSQFIDWYGLVPTFSCAVRDYLYLVRQLDLWDHTITQASILPDLKLNTFFSEPDRLAATGMV